jgi:hypothetical protein
MRGIVIPCVQVWYMANAIKGLDGMLWTAWMDVVMELKPACKRTRTFLWMVVFLIAMTVRMDMAGVTSCVRALGLHAFCYDRLLDFLHSTALEVDALTKIWVRLVFRRFQTLFRVNGRPVLLGDGLKIPKEGKKMPGVKLLHQSSDTNSKAEYIMGHSCQALSILAKAGETFSAVPLVCRIHEGIVFSNRDKRTLFDRMIDMTKSLSIPEPCYLVMDKYYANRKMIAGLLDQGHHLVTSLKKKAVAYAVPDALPENKRSRGRPRKYGEKISLRKLFEDTDAFVHAESPAYGEKNVTIRYRVSQLYWRSSGEIVRIVHVIHPTRGRIILMTTDSELPAIEVIRLYSLRYKIEFSFKQAIRTIGTYTYHFWMRSMIPVRRRSGDQYMHHKSAEYRDAVRRKLSAYHRYTQLGLIVQGLLQYLACTMPDTIWKKFGSWLRTVRTGIPPSEQVTAMALRNCFPEFIADTVKHAIVKKFLSEKIDLHRSDGINLAA